MTLHHFPPPRLEGHHIGRGAWYELFHFMFWIAILAAVVVLVVWMITAMRRTASAAAVAAVPSGRVDPAFEEARLRYARGELTREDYLRIASDLGGQQPPPG